MTKHARSAMNLAQRIACVSALLLPLSACNILGPAIYFAHGPLMIEAQYEIPPERSVVIFVDDRENVLRDRSMRAAISRAAEQALLEGGAVPKGEIISSDGIAAVTAADRWGRPQGIAQVGEAVGADLVIYATIDSFGISADGTSLAPFGSMRVKVVDASDRQRLWPSEEQPWGQVATAVPRRDGTLPESGAARSAEEFNLAKRMGNDLAKLFVRHEANPRENEIGR